MTHQQSDSGRTEQIISQFFLKILQAVLAARIPHIFRSSKRTADEGGVGTASAVACFRRRDRWFNLSLGEIPAALETLGLWHHGVMEPMVVDIILSPLEAAESEAVIERWTIQCEPPPPWTAGMISPNRGDGAGGSSSSSSPLYRRTYKKSILLLRTVYSLLRFLPAYRLFRLLCSSNQSYNYDISYRVSSFAEPFSREEEKSFKLQNFTPVETLFGLLSVSVLYRPTLLDFNLEISTLLPPMIIPDYVGSPAADPMRAFPASPSERGMRPISFPLRTSETQALRRPHSWNPAPMAHHPLHSSVREQRPSPPEYFRHRIAIPRQSGPRKGSFSYEEHWLSPPFSASPTPSPPAHANNAFQAKLRSETAPVGIPQPLMGKSSLHRSPNFSDPSRSLLPPPSPRSQREDLTLEESPSVSGSLRKLETLRMGDVLSNLYTVPKVLKDTRDDSGRFSGVLSSRDSPKFFISRSSSRKSMLDDLDDSDFSCPFAVDDVDTSDSRNQDGKETVDSAQAYASPHRSQDAAVGALVHALRAAPPLRQDRSYSLQSSKSEINSNMGSSSIFQSRKKSDALEELRSYCQMKQILLSKSRTETQDTVNQ
ncbi:hypothetical protein HPP92_014464 [Vanilla planifolia]|uniref:Autophagy-related protein 13 N-terminal domain-containing protein n=1 Tax=Vanilla planifolia TaxID=51239 RepID=A0A835QPL3_VANPL|nr:hypothetical protein HPP92_014464 [Vanilla planifolia]